MSWAEGRLTVNQIKSHQFFYGADWNALRLIEPPFVPRLQSITDTSYFPTDDFGNVPEQLEQVQGVGAEKDLAFLGYNPLFYALVDIDGFAFPDSLSSVLLEGLNLLDRHLLSFCTAVSTHHTPSYMYISQSISTSRMNAQFQSSIVFFEALAWFKLCIVYCM